MIFVFNENPISPYIGPEPIFKKEIEALSLDDAIDTYIRLDNSDSSYILNIIDSLKEYFEELEGLDLSCYHLEPIFGYEESMDLITAIDEYDLDDDDQYQEFIDGNYTNIFQLLKTLAENPNEFLEISVVSTKSTVKQ